MNKCKGCGTLIDNNDLCERCFRIKHYNDYKVVYKTNNDFIPILENINKTNDLVLLVVDLFNIGDLSFIRKYLKNDILLVLTKRDLLPKSVSLDKLYSYDYKIDFIDKIIISSNKNYNFDELLEKINKYKKTNNVYVVGYTNAGKSTMINKLIYNYSDLKTEITTSPLPSTTLNTIEIKLNGITLIDTPGLIEVGSLLNVVEPSMVKKISPVKEIKPKTYQIRKNQSIIIEDFLRVDYVDGERNSFTLYISNNLKVKRLLNASNHDELKDLNKTSYTVKYGEDLVISGLGFIKMIDKCQIDVYIDKSVDTYLRRNMI